MIDNPESIMKVKITLVIREREVKVTRKMKILNLRKNQMILELKRGSKILSVLINLRLLKRVEVVIETTNLISLIDMLLSIQEIKPLGNFNYIRHLNFRPVNVQKITSHFDVSPSDLK